MEMDRRLTMLAVIAAGLAIGFAFQVVVPNLSLGGPEIITSDPDLSSFSAQRQEYTVNSSTNITDIPYIKKGKKYGPWRSVQGQYVPASLLRGREEGAYITQIEDGELGNAYQFTRLPDAEMEVVMVAKNARDVLGIESTSCTTANGFVTINGWDGPVSFDGMPSADQLWPSGKIVKRKPFTVNTSRLVLEVPDRFEGEKMVFYGGVRPRLRCEGAGSRYLEVKKLYVQKTAG